jgi:hypothetical protein
VNTAQQELVRTTFARPAVMPEVAGALFHKRLFAANPSFRALFKNDKLSVRDAWTACYNELAGEMKAAAGVWRQSSWR